MPAGLEAVAIALGLSFGGVFAYLVYLHVVQRRIIREVETLREAIDARGEE